MSEEFWDLFWEKLKRIYEERDRNTIAYDSEKPILEMVLKEIEKRLKDVYDFVKPIDRGGAGIVIQLKDKRLNFDRALKIPRPKDEELIESVKNEIEYLTKIRHENIISIYALGDVEVPGLSYPYPYFVMDYIEEAQTLRRKTLSLLDGTDESKRLSEITGWILDKVYRIAKAVNFLHQHQIIHFDIKPSNILIDINDKPILSDLGFAKKKTEDEEPIVVGFTLFYAHPGLKAEYSHMSSKNRVRGKRAPKDFSYIWISMPLGSRC
jgi:serine/threonine protein kinase